MSKRYCVTCGQILTDENERGLLCVDCYAQFYPPGRRRNTLVLEIRPDDVVAFFKDASKLCEQAGYLHR